MSNIRISRRLGLSLLAWPLIAVSGCGNTATVSGKVSYQGRPVHYGSVILLSADKTARACVIQPDGSYTVEGVPAGTVKVGVISRDPSKGRSVLRGQKNAQPNPKKRFLPPAAARGGSALPSRLEDPAHSGLTCHVVAGRVSHDIDLR